MFSMKTLHEASSSIVLLRDYCKRDLLGIASKEMMSPKMLYGPFRVILLCRSFLSRFRRGRVGTEKGLGVGAKTIQGTVNNTFHARVCTTTSKAIVENFALL